MASHFAPLHVRVCPICGLFWYGQHRDECPRCEFRPDVDGARRLAHHRPAGASEPIVEPREDRGRIW